MKTVNRHSNPAFMHTNLQEKIRSGEEPDNPNLIRQYLDLSPQAANSDLIGRRQHFVVQCRLLIETIVDECLPPHF